MRKTIILAAVLIIAAVVVSVVWKRAGKPVPLEEREEVDRVRDVTLYFASTDGASLVPEYRQIASSDRILDNLRRVIEAVISGPGGDAVPTLPSSVRVLGVYIHDKTAYIDFSREIAEDFSGGTAAEYMLVASIVQTACANFPQIESVCILVEGRQADTVGGHLRISQVLRPEDWR